MISRSAFCRAFIAVVATSLLIVVDARAQDPGQEFIESVVPFLKTLREFGERIDSKLATLKRKLGGKPDQNDFSEPPEPAPEPLGPLPDPKYQEQLRREFREEMYSALREQFQLVEKTRKHLRLYVSLSVDKCKQMLADKDEAGARRNCGLGDSQIEHCKRQIAPEINQMAAQQTGKFKSYLTDSAVFSTINCDLVFAGLDDPARLLRKAEFRLPDSACYAHTDRVEDYVKTGVVKSRLGPDDASVSAYLNYIKRMCSEKIAEEAVLVVNNAKRLKLEEELKLAEEELARTKVPPEEEPIILTRKGGSAAGALFQGAINQAEQEERDPAAREARERNERARAVEAREAAIERGRRAERNAQELRQALGDLTKALVQKPDKSSSTDGGDKTSSPFCKPGAGYEAKKCSCFLNPAGTGCAGAPTSERVYKWATPSPKNGGH